MATTIGAAPADIVARLNKQGMDFDYNTLINLLLNVVKECDLLIKPAAQVCFSTKVVEKIEIIADKCIQLTVNGYGLYGLDSPLPQLITKLCLQDSKVGECMCCFLDIFQQRCYQMLFSAWKKHRPITMINMTNSHYYLSLHALAGCSDLANTAHYLQRNQNRSSLLALLQTCVPNINVNIIEFIARWVTVPTQWILGCSATALGEHTVLGTKVLNCDRHINIMIGPIDELCLQKLLLTQRVFSRITALTKNYLTPTFFSTIILLVKFDRAARTCLLPGHLQLSCNTILGHANGEPYKLSLIS